MEDITAFLGRFHPLVVHLPIGILMMAGLMQILAWKSKKYANTLDSAIGLILFWGGISSIGAVAIGWLLSLQGGYDETLLFWHKWLGVLVTLMAFICWFSKTKNGSFYKSAMPITLFFVILLISVSGHLGGSLTHGEDYLLQYAPKFIKNIAGASLNDNESKLHSMPADSIIAYTHVIQPILDKKCVSCHSSSKKRGGLLLTNYSELLKGGDNGSIIDVKNPLESEFLNRVTLPKGHKLFMPPKGNALTFSEIQITKWWMKSGADSISKFSQAKNLDDELLNALIRDYQLDYYPKPYYEKVIVDSLPTASLTELKQNEFVVDFMGEFNHMISVRYKGDDITKEQIEKLLLAKEQITWLDLNNSNVTDELLEILPNFKNLTRLNLHSNPITDKGIKELISLSHLTSLNLYNTKISGIGLTGLVQLESLSRLYVWNTDITTLEIQELTKKHPQIDIIASLN